MSGNRSASGGESRTTTKARPEDHLLAGKHLVIVGGSSGIGLAVARQADAAGARLTLLGRDAAKLDGASEQFAQAQARTIDLRRAETVSPAVEGLGPVDYLVISAGSYAAGALADSEPASWREILEERLIGPLAIIKALAPRLTTSIVLFSGTIAHRPRPGTVLISAATAAVESAVRALALELAPVRVNAIAPGMIDTPMLDGLLGTAKTQISATIAAGLPVRRIGAPEDVAAATLLLLTNPFITGVTLKVDGGAPLV